MIFAEVKPGDLKADTLPVGIDGCAAPNYALPLARLARAMAKLGDTSSLPMARAKAAERLTAAWRRHPLLVSGTGRACAELIEGSIGRVRPGPASWECRGSPWPSTPRADDGRSRGRTTTRSARSRSPPGSSPAGSGPGRSRPARA